jgi:hypothetical protein
MMIFLAFSNKHLDEAAMLPQHVTCLRAPAPGRRPWLVQFDTSQARPSEPASGGRARRLISGRRTGGRIARVGAIVPGSGAASTLAPVRLRVDTGQAHTSPTAPRTLERALRAPQVGDHAAAAAAGHTLPRPMRAVAVLTRLSVLTGHESLRLASLRACNR